MKFRGPARLPGRPDRARAPLPLQYLDSRDLSGACYSILPIESTLRPRHPVRDGLAAALAILRRHLGYFPPNQTRWGPASSRTSTVPKVDSIRVAKRKRRCVTSTSDPSLSRWSGAPRTRRSIT